MLYRTQVGGGIQVDIIGNFFKQGPLDKPYPNSTREIQAWSNSADETAVIGEPSIYLNGNKGYSLEPPNPPSQDQWEMARQVTGENGTETGAIPEGWKRSFRLSDPTIAPIIPEPVGGLENNLLPIVGASQRLDCQGKWVANRDTVDIRLISQYKTNKGNKTIIKSEKEVGGFPIIVSDTPCTDSDFDGMPNK